MANPKGYVEFSSGVRGNDCECWGGNTYSVENSGEFKILSHDMELLCPLLPCVEEIRQWSANFYDKRPVMRSF